MRFFKSTIPATRRGFLGLAVWAVVGLTSGLIRPGIAQTAGQSPNLPSVFVVGDSTARNNANGAQGWGDPFKDYFDTTKVNVLNRAMAGRSSRSYFNEGRWDNVFKEMKAGDFVLLQMGHNDGGPVDSGKARARCQGWAKKPEKSPFPTAKKRRFTLMAGICAASSPTPRPKAPRRLCCRSRFATSGKAARSSADREITAR